MIQIEPYKPIWREEFFALGRAIRQALGDLALRIDHIGSTAVPDLAAKDIIDIQVTAASLDPAIEQALNHVAYKRIEGITQDHVPPEAAMYADEWRKWLFKPTADQRPVNVHIRVSGRANQRYALLFRDYLRAHSATAQAYAQVKVALAKYHPDDTDAYYDVKDPVCDIIIGGAEEWAAAVQWGAGPTDC